MKTRIKLSGPVSDAPAAQYLDITPTWAAIMPALVAALQDGTGEGQRIARAELARLAAEVDGLNARARAEREAMPPAAELARLIREATPDNLGRVIADCALHASPLAFAIRENLAKPDNARALAVNLGPAPSKGEASHLKTATAALAGVLADYAATNARDAREGTGGHAWRAVFHARAGAFYHAASDAAARGGNNGAELKKLGAEETDKATDARAAAVRELADMESERDAARRAIRRAFESLAAVMADAGTDGNPPRLMTENPAELARAIADAGDALQGIADNSAAILARFHPVT